MRIVCISIKYIHWYMMICISYDLHDVVYQFLYDMHRSYFPSVSLFNFKVRFPFEHIKAMLSLINIFFYVSRLFLLRKYYI